MSKEKIISLSKYVDDLKNRASSKELPAKHLLREVSYKAYLETELKKAMAQIERLKLEIIK